MDEDERAVQEWSDAIRYARPRTGMKAIVGERVDFAKLRESYEGLGWAPTLVALAQLAGRFANEEGDQREEFVRDVAVTLAKFGDSTDPVAVAVRKYFDTHREAVVISEDGLYEMMGLAIMHGSDGTAMPTQGAIYTLALLTNDFVGEYFAERGVAEKDVALAGLVGAYRFKDRGEIQEALVRAKAIFSAPPRDPKALAIQGEIEATAFDGDFDTWFSRFAVPLMFMATRWGQENPIVEPTLWGKALFKDTAWLVAQFNRIAKTRAVLDVELRRIAPFGLSFNTESVLTASPFVWFGPDKLVGLSPRLLMDHLKLGIWGRFRNAYVKHGVDSKAWLGDFGVKFESWCREVARQAEVDGRGVIKAHLSQDVGSDDEIEDVVLEGEAIVFFACKGRLIPAAARGRVNPTKILTWLEQVFFAPASKRSRQRGGALVLFEKSLAKYRKAFAGSTKAHILCVVTYDPIGDTHLLQSWLWRERQARKVLLDEDVGHIFVLSVNEYERLLSVTVDGLDPTDFLLRKSRDPNRFGMPIDSFLESEGITVSRPTWILDRIKTIGDAVTSSVDVPEAGGTMAADGVAARSGSNGTDS